MKTIFSKSGPWAMLVMVTVLLVLLLQLNLISRVEVYLKEIDFEEFISQKVAAWFQEDNTEDISSNTVDPDEKQVVW